MNDIAILEKLDELTSLLKKNKIRDKWMNLAEATLYSGLSASTLRRAIQRGQLKTSKITGKIMFKRSWIDKYLVFGKVRVSAKQERELERL